MTNFALAERRPLEGQRPRHLWVPPYLDDSHGRDALELAESIGLIADDWQRDVTIALLATREDDRWAAFEFGLEVARQNGKGGVYEIRELYGLFVLRERLLIHSAHEYKTAEQALDRMEALIDGSDDLRREVRTIKRSHGQEGIYLKTGQVLRYFTRTASGGRGFSCDFLGLDEAMKIKHSMHAAMFPTMSARPNPQILYAGSAVDQDTMDDGIVFARLRERAIDGGDPRMAYFGYSAPFDHPDEVTEEDALNPEHWAAANPSLGSARITPEYIEMEQRALSARGFAVERLGVGDWPETDESEAWRVISADSWRKTVDPASEYVGQPCYAVSVTPKRDFAAVALAGVRADGLFHITVVEHRAGTGWVARTVADLVAATGATAVACQGGSAPSATLITPLAQLGIGVSGQNGANSSDLARASGVLYDLVDQVALRHTNLHELNAAVKGATKRVLTDGWAWSQTLSSVDITPLVACTLALGALVDAGAGSGGFEW